MLPIRSIIFVVALSTIIVITLLHPATHHSFCTSSYSLPHSVPDQQHDSRKLHFLLPVNAGAASQSRLFCQTLLSALVHGYAPIIINWDVERDWESMQRMKVTGAYEYLTNITDNNAEADLVLMVDALDVWFQASPRTLIERFEELGTSGVVVGAEVNCCCWPNEFESIRSAACRNVPNSTVPEGVFGSNEAPRSANSGTVMGSVAAMRTLFKELGEVLQEPERQNQGDQGVFNEFLASRLGHLSLDYRSRLFWATAYSSPSIVAHFINSPHYIDALIPHKLYPPLLYHSQTGEVPSIIHFNGPDKHFMEEWWGKLWWNKLQDGDERFRDIVSSRVEGAVVRFAGGGSREWRDFCPKEIIGI